MPSIRNRYLFLSDLLLLAAAPLVAYAIRFEGPAWSSADRHTASVYTVVSVVLKLGIFLPFGMYGRLWRHASVPDLAKIIEATATAAVARAGAVGAGPHAHRPPQRRRGGDRYAHGPGEGRAEGGAGSDGRPCSHAHGSRIVRDPFRTGEPISLAQGRDSRPAAP